MADLDAQLSITADASGVEAGVGKAKRSLKDLGATAEGTGKQASAGMDTVRVATGRAAQAIDRSVYKMQLAAATVGKSAAAAQLFELRQRGASQAQLQAAAAALKQVDVHQKWTEAIQRQEAAAKRLGAYLATLSVGATLALAKMARSALDTIDSFNDLADSTGASIENISALDRIARATGGTFSQVSSTLVKFNQVLKDAGSKNDAGAVFKALNLELSELQRLDPAEALRQTAVALQGFADDGNKARIIQELFGKSVREAAPFLKDLAEAQGLVGTVSTRTADEVDRFNKEMSKLQANATDVWRSMSYDGVASLNKIIDRFNTARASGKSFWEAQSEGYWAWVRDFYGMQQPAATGFQPTFSPDDQSAAETARLRRRPSLPTLPERTNPRGPHSDPQAEAKRYLESLQKQIESTQDLTVYEQALTDIQQNRLGKLTPELEKSILATARQVDAAKQAAAALEGMTRARELAMQMQDRADESAAASVEQQIAANDALREEIELIGLSVSARVAVEKARLSSALALKEEELILARNAEASAAQISALEREIVLLRERQGLLGQKEQRTAAVEAQEQAKEFSDGVRDDLKRAFSDALRDTDNPLQAFGDALYSTITARVTAALAESLATRALDFLGLGAAGGGGFLGALFGPGKANGGQVSPGRIYPVNERGPELLSVGNRDFLMMGNQPGNVTPNHQLGGRSMVVNNHFTIQGSVDRRSEATIARAVTQKLAIAQQRWG